MDNIYVNKQTTNMMNTNLTLEELREEIYNNFIQEYYNLSHEEVTELVDIELENRLCFLSL